MYLSVMSPELASAVALVRPRAVVGSDPSPSTASKNVNYKSEICDESDLWGASEPFDDQGNAT